MEPQQLHIEAGESGQDLLGSEFSGEQTGAAAGAAALPETMEMMEPGLDLRLPRVASSA